ncbi:MAG TPA: hypothetical protein VEZ41_11900, partial [Allosphingosinicella sp.]|nr:hypothetical protein [Allosphingosinicella sp.]
MRGMIGLAALLLLAGCGGGKEEANETGVNEAGTTTASLDRACASAETYDRLKELAFDEAARIRGDGAPQLDTLSDAAVVRMENPVVGERDAELGVTTCSGRFILELPPGSENAFDGERRLTADVEYAAQTAADGSGLVYQMEGAEPIIYRLATIGGLARAAKTPAPPPMPTAAPPTRTAAAPEPAPAPPAEQPAPPPRRTAEAAPRPTAPPVRPTTPAASPAAPAPSPASTRQASAGARPSFNCAGARSRGERMVCGSGALAALDRRMSAVFYSALAGGSPEVRANLR